MFGRTCCSMISLSFLLIIIILLIVGFSYGAHIIYFKYLSFLLVQDLQGRIYVCLDTLYSGCIHQMVYHQLCVQLHACIEGHTRQQHVLCTWLMALADVCCMHTILNTHTSMLHVQNTHSHVCVCVCTCVFVLRACALLCARVPMCSVLLCACSCRCVRVRYCPIDVVCILLHLTHTYIT